MICSEFYKAYKMYIEKKLLITNKLTELAFCIWLELSRILFAWKNKKHTDVHNHTVGQVFLQALTASPLLGIKSWSCFCCFHQKHSVTFLDSWARTAYLSLSSFDLFLSGILMKIFQEYYDLFKVTTLRYFALCWRNMTWEEDDNDPRGLTIMQPNAALK